MARKSLFVFCSLLIIMGLIACSNTSKETGTSNEQETSEEPAKVDPIKLKVADSFPTSHVLSKEGAVFWMNRVTELTDGQVEFEHFPAEQLGKAASLLDLARTKTTDIAYVGTAYVADRMPLSGVGELPGAFQSSNEGSTAFWKIANGILLEEEFLENGVRPVWAVTLTPYQIANINKKMVKIGDFKGEKIRTAGGTQDLTMNQMGATPVSMPAPEMYSAMDRGTLDGAVAPLNSFKPYQMEQKIKYSTTNANLGSFVVNYVINEEIYASLPKNVQEAMKQAGDETVEYLSKFLDDETEKLIEEFEGIGIDMYELTDEQLEAWSKQLDPVWEQWAKGLEDRGYPANDVIKAFEEALGK
ncbi:TRAP transporter substrate-binding protein DctP [Bacillaceae bacterium S4-13-56]